MSATPLRLFPESPLPSRPARPASRPSRQPGPPRTRRTLDELALVEQVHEAGLQRSRTAMVIGGLFGAFAPLAVFTLAHAEAPARPWLWLVVAGGLLFSGLAVFETASKVFGNPWKAGGFVLILEACSVASETTWLAFAALLLLVVVNGVVAGVRVALEPRQEVRP